jgi:hypothetical protein
VLESYSGRRTKGPPNIMTDTREYTKIITVRRTVTIYYSWTWWIDLADAHGCFSEKQIIKESLDKLPYNFDIIRVVRVDCFTKKHVKIFGRGN